MAERAEHRVAITGIGLVTPLGTGAAAFWENVLAGKIAVEPLTRFDSDGFATRIAAQIDDFDPNDFLSKRRVQWTDRFSQFTVAAARLAVDDAQFPLNGDRGGVGV